MLLILVAATPAVAFAQAPTGAPTTLGQLYTAVCTVSNWFFAFVLILAVIALIYAGYLFFSSGGGEKVTQAKKALFYGLIGATVAILAKSLVLVIGNLLGVDVAGFFGC